MVNTNKKRLKHWLIALILIGIVSTKGVQMVSATEKGKNGAAAIPRVELKTSLGTVVLELNPQKAPETVANFLHYVDARFYDGTIFHRVIANFMIQGGGFTKGLSEKPNQPPIKNEAGNGLSNLRGAVAMARTQEVNSATSQFYINVVDNKFLDHRDNSAAGFGYCVFGKVIQGMDVVDKIKAVPTKTVSFYENVPATDVVIISARRVE